MNESSRWTEEEMETAKKGNTINKHLFSLQSGIVIVVTAHIMEKKSERTLTSAHTLFFPKA